ncbi:MAG: iron ABC transporter permease [Alphaproteobacteria bacterium]|nr:iron ABC transporter permease [Alphaproteobacteria bacterium]
MAEAADGAPTPLQASRGAGRSMKKPTLIFLLGLLGALILGPLAVLLITSFSSPETLFYREFTFTFQNYLDVATRPGTAKLIWNTFYYAAASVVLGVSIAFVLSMLTERTDMPARRLIRTLMFSWMAVPPLVFGYGWILLINPGNGALNVFLRNLFGFEGAPFSPYSMTALIVISSLSLVPTSYVMISGLLRNMDPSLEDAGFVMGAGRLRVFRTVTLPILTPGFLSVGMFLFINMVQTFDLPLVLGASAGVHVLSTRIYLLASPEVGLPNYGLAGAFGVFLLVVALLLMVYYFHVTRLSERFRVVTGRGFRPKRLTLGVWRLPALLFTGGYFAVMTLPLLILLWSSLLPFYKVPSLDELANLTVGAYGRILGDPTIMRAIGNTVLMVLVSSVVVMVLSCLISWFSVRAQSAATRALDVMAFAPIAIPPVVMAIAMLLFFLPTPLYGLIWVIVIGHITMFIAFGARTMNGAFIQIHKELEDAAEISGASWGTSLRRVVAPLVWPHIVNAWLWVAAHSARDLTFPLILLTSSNVVVASKIYMTWGYPDLPGAAALSMLMVGALMAVVIPIQYFRADD